MTRARIEVCMGGGGRHRDDFRTGRISARFRREHKAIGDDWFPGRRNHCLVICCPPFASAMNARKRWLVLSFVLSTSCAYAATVKDREGAVRQDRATMENDARWIYNDIDRGFAEAKKIGKPLLV